MIYPAIDLMNNSVVRLVEGDFGQMTQYSTDPVQQALKFEEFGAKFLHVVDLDGAKMGKPQQFETIKKIVESTKLKVQVGGGIRSVDDVKKYVSLGVDRVVIGSLSVKNPELFQSILNEFKNKITLSVDVGGNNEIKISGWQESTSLNVFDFLKDFENLSQVLCTDITKDGKLKGINKDLYLKLKKLFPQLCFLASGGVSHIDDVLWAESHKIGGVIVGKAIYENKVSLKELFDAH